MATYESVADWAAAQGGAADWTLAESSDWTLFTDPGSVLTGLTAPSAGVHRVAITGDATVRAQLNNGIVWTAKSSLWDGSLWEPDGRSILLVRISIVVKPANHAKSWTIGAGLRPKNSTTHGIAGTLAYAVAVNQWGAGHALDASSTFNASWLTAQTTPAIKVALVMLGSNSANAHRVYGTTDLYDSAGAAQKVGRQDTLASDSTDWDDGADLDLILFAGYGVGTPGSDQWDFSVEYMVVSADDM